MTKPLLSNPLKWDCPYKGRDIHELIKESHTEQKLNLVPADSMLDAIGFQNKK